MSESPGYPKWLFLKTLSVSSKIISRQWLRSCYFFISLLQGRWMEDEAWSCCSPWDRSKNRCRVNFAKVKPGLSSCSGCWELNQLHIERKRGTWLILWKCKRPLGLLGSGPRCGDSCPGHLLRGEALQGGVGRGSEGSKLWQEKGSDKARNLALSVISWRPLECGLHRRVIPTLGQGRADLYCPLISLAEIIGCRPFTGHLSCFLPTYRWNDLSCPRSIKGEDCLQSLVAGTHSSWGMEITAQ